MGGCVSGESVQAPAYIFNFSAEPTADETELWTKVGQLTSKAPTHIERLVDYKGCDSFIRVALSEPTPDSEAAAWKAVEKSVDILYKFWKFSLDLEEIFPQLLTAICSNKAKVAHSNALVKQLAQIFEYAFHFDELKMVNPNIQNDFSYYRRVLARMRSAGNKTSSKTKVTEEVANKMSFHFAYPTPVMKALIASTTSTEDATALAPGLTEVANVACAMAEHMTTEDDASTLRLLQCLLTGCVILVDHLEPAGVFHKGSPVRIRQCITLLKAAAANQNSFGLLNSLRFSTLHLADETTPPGIMKLFD